MTAENMTEQYFIRARGGDGPYQAVDRETYVEHERNAGFTPKKGSPKHEPCTSAFSDSRYAYEGKITYG